MDELDENGKPKTPAEPPKTPDASEIANRAATEHARRVEKKIREEYDAKFAALEERFAARAPAAKKEEEPVEGEGEKQTVKARTAKLEQETAKLRAELEKSRSEGAEKEKVLQAKEQRATIDSALKDAGVINTKGAYAVLQEDGMIGRDEDGKLVFKLDGDEHSVKEGLEKWLATADGKHYLPPVGSGGSGQTGKTRGKRAADGKMTKEEADDAIANAFFGQRR